MLKVLLVLSLYISAAILVWAGMEIAPDMTWPRTSAEIIAAHFLVIGMCAKLAGHCVLLFGTQR